MARFVLAFLAVVASPFAAAQGLGLGTSSSSGGTTLVEEGAVIANARDAFRQTAAHMVSRYEAAGVGDSILGRLRTQAGETSAAFEDVVRRTVNELKGDGVLGAGEVSAAVDELRQQHLEDLRIAMDAISAGHAPPPVAGGFESTSEYVVALARYTFTERNPPRYWLLVLAGLAGGIIVGYLAGRFLDRVSSRLSRAGRAGWVYLVDALTPSLYVVTAALGIWFGLQWLWIPGVADEAVDRGVVVAMVIALFLFLWLGCAALAEGITWLANRAYPRKVDRHITLVIRRILNVVVLVTFVFTLVSAVWDSDLTAVLAGLGIVGILLGLVLRSSIQNIVASFTIFSDKPFRIGDMVEYGDDWGTIEDVGLRSTRFRNFDGHLYHIPNSKLVDEAICNVGARPSIRRRFRISLPYATPPEKVREAMGIVREIIDDHEHQPADAGTHAVFERFGPWDLVILVEYYYRPPDYWEALEFDTGVNLAIMERFQQAGIEFAFPTEVSVLTGDPGNPPRLDVVQATTAHTGDRRGAGEAQESVPRGRTSGRSGGDDGDDGNEGDGD